MSNVQTIDSSAVMAHQAMDEPENDENMFADSVAHRELKI
jgi:hypothetical protein